MSEGNTKFVLHDRSIDRIKQLLRGTAMPEDDVIANTIESQSE